MRSVPYQNNSTLCFCRIDFGENVQALHHDKEVEMRLWHPTNRLLFLAIAIASLTLFMPGCKSLRKNGAESEQSLVNFRKKNKPSNQEELSSEYLDPLGARNADRIVLDDLSPSQISTTIKTRWLSQSDSSTASQSLSRGKELFASASSQHQASPEGEDHLESFTEAANQFRVASANAPDSAIEEESFYLEGEAYFFANRYVQANRAFEKLVAKYPGTRFLDLAEQKRLAIAQYWLELDENGSKFAFNDPQRPKTGMAGEARRILHRIRVDDPTGTYADDATIALGKAFLRDENYYDAADTFKDIRTNYPQSRYQYEAHMLELQSHLQGYKGPSYDATPLTSADEILDQMVRKFPRESQDNLDHLEQSATLIRNQLAERDYVLGDHYAKRGENRAAKLCYERVAENYSDTQYGRTVTDRIADVSSKPPVPAQHAEWLVNLFPDDTPAKPIIASRDDRVLR